jgi:hypothetical protein
VTASLKAGVGVGAKLAIQRIRIYKSVGIISVCNDVSAHLDVL